MQPYFMPYIGYFQLIAAVDVFVVYDNIKYTKKGWINRNRMLLNDSDALFSLPLSAGTDTSNVVERKLAESFDPKKLLNQFRGAYGRAPYVADTFPLLHRIVSFEDRNLFRFIHHSIVQICAHLGINTEIRVSSSVAINHQLQSSEKVYALCQAVGADTYINPTGGTTLYDKRDFADRGIDLLFLKSRQIEYAQFGAPFVPWLSIVDLLMFNPLDRLAQMITDGFELQ